MEENKFTSIPRDDFSGGVNYYYGSRQIDDNESPEAINCDFKGKTGVGNRAGYTQLGSPSTYNIGKGLSEFHTSLIDQAIKFVSNNTNTILSYSTGSAWTDVVGTTFANANVDSVQGGGKLYTGDGSSVMREWNGTTWADTTNGTKGYYPEYYNSRIWVKDEQNEDMLNFSGQFTFDSTVTNNYLGDFTTANGGGWIRFKAGSGAKITGIKSFKSALYVFLTDSIYRVTPASSANTFTVELITNSVGCVSHRSIKQVEEDLYFAGQDGVYSLGDVANYTSVRTTNKSSKIQRIFDNLTAIQKSNLVGCYYKFKYYLFYTLSGDSNNACAVYDIRYKAWQDWRNIAGNDAKIITLQNEQRMFFIENSAKVQEMGVGATDDGSPINSYWTSKSFDEKLPDVMKFYFDTSFLFGTLNGSADLSVVFDDYQVAVSKTLTQNKPQGGFGRDVLGKTALGKSTNVSTIVQVYNYPQRLKAKGKKYAISYKVESSDQWRLDSISQYASAFDHMKITPSLKLN